jgi:hypothetical protein
VQDGRHGFCMELQCLIVGAQQGHCGVLRGQNETDVESMINVTLNDEFIFDVQVSAHNYTKPFHETEQELVKTRYS